MGWMKPKPVEVISDTTATEALEAARIKAAEAFERQEHFLQRISDANPFTPDIRRLERKMRWLLFVPDELMKQHHDHARLGAHAVKISEAFTVERFSLWKQRYGKRSTAIPLRLEYNVSEDVLKTPLWRQVRRYPVRGELYFVNASTLIKLDTHRENGLRFQRERVQVVRPYTKVTLKRLPLTIEKQDPVQTYVRFEERLLGEPLSVWMYTGVREYWDEKLDAGALYQPVRHYKPHNTLLSEYHYFSVEEYESS